MFGIYYSVCQINIPKRIELTQLYSFSHLKTLLKQTQTLEVHTPILDSLIFGRLVRPTVLVMVLVMSAKIVPVLSGEI